MTQSIKVAGAITRPGEAALVESVQGEPAVVQRLLELGLLEGERIELLTLAPLGDPLEVRLGHTRLSLRRREAAAITVRRDGSS